MKVTYAGRLLLVMWSSLLIILGCSKPTKDGALISKTADTAFYLNGTTQSLVGAGKGGNAIYGGDVSNDVFYAHLWQGERFIPCPTVSINGNVFFSRAFLSQADKWLFTEKKGGNEILYLYRAGIRKIIDEHSNDVYVSTSTVSENGRYVGVALRDNRGRDIRHPIGFMEVQTERFHWLHIPLWKDPFYKAEVALPSNDGKYLAVAGIGAHLLLVDVKSTNRLWRMSSEEPDDIHAEVSGIRGVAFSPDSEVLYFGEGMGYLYRMETRTGKMLGRWEASIYGEPSDQSGRRFQDVAASPDGRFVAGGTGPTGEVFVWDVTTGKLVNVFVHGWTISLVQFSPDSKHLATMAGSNVKVWPINLAQPKATNSVATQRQ